MKKIVNHLKENWIKYGFETFVIIVGILGAFTLNNWNDSLKTKDKEKIIIAELNREFKTNKEQLRKVIDTHQKALIACDVFIDLFPIDESKINFDTLQFYYGWMLQRWTFNPSQGTINSIVNSASFDIISNYELRGMIVSWDDVFNDYAEDEIRASSFMDNSFDPFLYKYLEVDMKLNDPRIDLSYLKSKEFENLVNKRRRMLDVILDSENEVTILSEHIKKIIELTEN